MKTLNLALFYCILIEAFLNFFVPHHFHGLVGEIIVGSAGLLAMTSLYLIVQSKTLPYVDKIGNAFVVLGLASFVFRFATLI